MTVSGDLYGLTATPQVVTDEKPRCWRCNRYLAFYATRPWAIQCSRCSARCQSEGDQTVTLAE